MRVKNNLMKFFIVTICLILAVATLVIFLTDSDLDDAPSIDELDGTSIAKLLLANHRLDSATLDEDNIFVNGVQTFDTLATKALSYAVSAPIVASEEDDGRIGSFSISGDKAEWSDFVEYNNSYSYFDNITSIITDTAKKGARFIDEAKDAVTVVDCWVKDGDEKYYLAVDENSETICKIDSTELFICRRHTDESGKTVYELYIEQESVYERVKYVPGERYELTQVISFDEGQALYFVADHSKGYWETLCTDGNQEAPGVTFTVMKDDICYFVDYDVLNQDVAVLGVMSADTKTDILKIYGNTYDLSITMQFAGFNGIERATADASDVDVNGNFIGEDGIVVYLSDGGTLACGTKQGDVLVDRIYMASLADGYIGSCDLTIGGDTAQDRWDNFSAFLSNNGITCRRDLSTVLSGVSVAEDDADNLIKYYRWNDYSIADVEGVFASMDAEDDRVEALKKIYTDIKDKPVVKRNVNSDNISSLDFADIKSCDSDNVVLAHGNVSIGSIGLTVDDTTLLEKDSSYVIALAIASVRSENTVVVAKSALTVYDGSGEFTVSGSSIIFDLPDLEEDEYTIVAFMATADGIRISDCYLLGFNSVTQEEISSIGKRIFIESTDSASGRIVTLIYQNTTDHIVDIELFEPVDYDTFIEQVSAAVFVYGTPDNEKPEKLLDGDYVAVDSSEYIASGTYRMAYTINNGDNSTYGYVYISVTLG